MTSARAPVASDDKDKPRPRCTAKTASGRPCRNSPLPGTTRCYHHSFRVPGRPSKLTPELQERIVDAVLEGNYLETAAQAAGVGKTTLYRWLRKAQDVEAAALEHIDPDADGEDVWNHTDPAEWPYLDFRHALQSAEAYSETEILRRALTAAPGWQAHMTYLERRHPQRWGRRDAHKHEHTGEVRRSVEVIVPTDAERAAVLSRLQEAGALDEDPGDENTTEEE